MLRRAGHVALVAVGLTALALIVRHIGLATIAGLLRQVGWSFWWIVLIYAAHTALRGLALWRTRRADAAVAAVQRIEGVLVGVLKDDPRRLATLLAVELASHALLALEVLVTLHAIGVYPGLRSAFVIEGGVKWIGTLFFFVPGQVGVSEGMYALLLPAVGLPAAAGVTIALIRRARALTVGGLGFLLIAAPSPNPPPPRPDGEGSDPIGSEPPSKKTREGRYGSLAPSRL